MDLGINFEEKAFYDILNPYSAGSSRYKVVFLAGRAKKGKNMFVLGGQINDSFNAVNL
jgi:hypothetical protein